MRWLSKSKALVPLLRCENRLTTEEKTTTIKKRAIRAIEEYIKTKISKNTAKQ